MEFPTWSKFKKSLEHFEKKLSDIETTVSGNIVEFKERHPFVAQFIEECIPILPPPFDKIADRVWNVSEGTEEDRADAVLEYLKTIEFQGEKHYQTIINSLEKLDLDLDKIEKEMAREETVKRLQTIMLSVGTDVEQQIHDLERTISMEIRNVGQQVNRVEEKVDDLKDDLKKVIDTISQKSYEQLSSISISKYGNSQVQLQTSRAFSTQPSTVHTTCFSKITEFWKQWGEGYLKENQYVTFEGTLSRYIPMIIGNPREKIELHRSVRRENVEKERRPGKNHLSFDTILAFTAGQMVWRPKLSREYVILGLYHSIVRNSIPVFISKNYFEKIQNQIFAINPYVVDIKLQGTLFKMNDTFESQFTGQKEISPRFFKFGESKPLYAISVVGNENTWLKDPTETTYLDGDIWIALETDNFHTTLSRFLDLSDTSFLIDEAKALRNDWKTKYPQARLIGQFDEVDKLVPESTESEKMKDVF